jgi:hypothetical protein
VADAVDEATGLRGFMARDMKPVFKAKVIGPAVTVLLRKALRNDKRDWPNLQIQTLDEAPPGSVMVEVLEDGLDIAGSRQLMATTAKVRGLAGMVIDGGARDIEELEEIGFPGLEPQPDPGHVGRPLRARRPATSPSPAGASSSATATGSWPTRPGSWSYPVESLPQVLKLLRQYDDKETADGAAHQGDEVDGQGAGEVQPLLNVGRVEESGTRARPPALRSHEAEVRLGG